MTDDTRDWLWFAAWTAVGASYALAVLSLLTIGPFLLPVPAIGTVLLARARGSVRGLPGLVTAVGLPLLLLAYLNRGGPGSSCSTTPGGEDCTDGLLNPWPLLAAGLVLVLAGAVLLVGRHRRARTGARREALPAGPRPWR
jgi:hypothetical protein